MICGQECEKQSFNLSIKIFKVKTRQNKQKNKNMKKEY